jgi:Na+-driven multidrug efflux pump
MEGKKKNKKAKDHVREQTLGYIGAALGFVAGLAWNDAIAAMIEQLYPAAKDTLAAKFMYAIVVTVVVIVLIMAINRAMRRDE